jgi:cobalamin biosynthesis protein CbiG
MDAKDKVLMVAALVGGAAAGYAVQGIAGALIGGFTGLGVLVVVYFIADQVDDILREHYRKI